MDLETAREMLETSNRNWELTQVKLKRANRILAFSYFLLFVGSINVIVAIYAMINHMNTISLITMPISALLIAGSIYSRYKTTQILK